MVILYVISLSAGEFPERKATADKNPKKRFISIIKHDTRPKDSASPAKKGIDPGRTKKPLKGQYSDLSIKLPDQVTTVRQ
jgi:hypothetical protein